MPTPLAAYRTQETTAALPPEQHSTSISIPLVRAPRLLLWMPSLLQGYELMMPKVQRGEGGDSEGARDDDDDDAVVVKFAAGAGGAVLLHLAPDIEGLLRDRLLLRRNSSRLYSEGSVTA